MITVERHHDFCAGHKVVGHEGKCRNLHGHNYRITFTVSGADLDDVGRVIDFSVIKEKLCNWLEEKWDHRMLIWDEDPSALNICNIDDAAILVPFNPTAENMAIYMVEVIAPKQLKGTGCTLIECKVQETYKCAAIYKK